MLASHFGDPAYWMDPALTDELLATALLVITPKAREATTDE